MVRWLDQVSSEARLYAQRACSTLRSDSPADESQLRFSFYFMIATLTATKVSFEASLFRYSGYPLLLFSVLLDA